MSEEHLALLSFATGDGLGLGLCDRTGLVASGLMNRARDFAREHIRTALGFKHTGVAVVLSGAIADRAVLCDALARRGRTRGDIFATPSPQSINYNRPGTSPQGATGGG